MASAATGSNNQELERTSVIRSRSKLNTSSREGAGDMIKTLLPSISTDFYYLLMLINDM